MFKIFYNFKFLFVITLSIFALSALESRADTGEDITISSDTLWVAGEYTYQDITVTNNATLTLGGDTDTNSGVTINARNIAVENGAKISADSQGFAAGLGQGAGTTYSGYGGGGGYGGAGANARYTSGELGLGGGTYGATINPALLGSGGGGSGGSGGGLIKLNLTGNLLVDGSISANGGDYTGGNGGGGSGGGILLQVVDLTGAGTISADGGLGEGIDGGAGGGGRIAIYHSGTNSFNYDNITVNEGGSGRVATDGTIFTFDSTNKNLTVNSDISFSTSSGIDENGNLSNDGIYNFNTLIINNNSTLNLESDTDTGTGTTIYANDIDIESGSYLSATGQGYGAASGPGGGYCDDTNCSNGTGGSYGGLGGTARYWNVVPDTYGEVMNPTHLGSGGGTSGGSNGGGSITLIVDGEISVDGGIVANGADTVSNRGAGSGGSIKINTTTVSGTGIISANGGNAPGDGGGGGGGRIAIYYSTMTLPTVNINSTGGDGFGDTCDGEDGSVFYYNVSTGDVEIANDLTLYANQGINRDGTLRTDGVYYYNNLTVTNSSTVTIASNWSNETDGRGVTINLDGDLTVESSSAITASGQGYTTGLGGGKGSWAGGLASGSGGGYGGAGGIGWTSTEGGATYGENQKYHPYFLGSSGGDAYGNPGGGTGGGAIAIRSLGDIEINGSISANGNTGGDGLSDYAGGGGSGGSVFLSGNTFSGTGIVSANGGNCGPGTNSKGGGGGGGRVSIAYFDTFLLNEANITASGGGGEGDVSRNGADGTVYIRKMDLPTADFDLVNPNNSSKQYTNSTDVSIEPEDPDADEYYESSNGDLTPTFYAPGWHKISEGKQLSAGEGVKTVKAWIKDNNQLISSAVGEATIILDQTKPILSVLQAGDTETTSDRIKISGTVADALSGVEYVVINGQQISGFVCAGPNILEGELVAIQDGSFEADINLGMGVNSITIVAYDRAGNSTTTSMNITRVASSEGDSSDDSPEDFNSYSEQPVSLSATPVHTIAPSHYIDSESDSIDFDKVDQDNDGDFSRDSDKLIFYRNDPTISGQSQPNALIEIILDNDRFQTDADIQGYWSYTFNNLSSGIHNLTINEYMRSGELIRSNSYVMEILNGAALQDDQEKTPLVKWWWLLIFLILILVSYWYYRKKFAKK